MKELTKFQQVKLDRIEEQIARFEKEVEAAREAHNANLRDFGTDSAATCRWTRKTEMRLDQALENLTHYQTRKWYLLNA